MSSRVAPDLVEDQPGPARSPVADALNPDPDVPFTGPFFKEVGKRKRNGRDAVILITADDADRGVGKTACAVTIAKLLDTTADGFDAESKATLSVPRFLDLYDILDEGSALILDEGEQLDSRRAMSQENVDASHKIQTRRVNEVIVIITLPSPDMIDKRVEQLADYWVNVECRGKARIYKKKIHRIKRKVYYKGLQTFQWPNLDGDPDYEALARMKDKYIDDDSDSSEWVRESEVQERLENAKQKVRKEQRDEYIKALGGIEDLRYKDFAPAFDLSPQRIGQIVRGE